MVSDNGDPPLKSTSKVVIQVLDANDNPPTFPQKMFIAHLQERAASEVPLPVCRLIASDRDEGQNSQVTYSIEDDEEGIFIIDPATGVVLSRKAFTPLEYNILTVRRAQRERAGVRRDRREGDTEAGRRKTERDRGKELGAGGMEHGGKTGR